MPGLAARLIASGVGRTEGPVIRADGEVLFVSMDQGVVYLMKGDRAEILATTGGMPNGVAEWSDGTLYVTQAIGRHFPPTKEPTDVGGIHVVSRTGGVRWLTRDPIAPNDLCFGPDGLLYCTDPTRRREARDDGRLFRCDVRTGTAELLCSVHWYPNGIAFGPEDDAVYVVRSLERQIVRMPLDSIHSGKAEVFVQMKGFHPDGFLFDSEGNLTAAAISEGDWPGEIQTFDRSGKQIDAFVPGTSTNYTNVALGPNRELIVTDGHGGGVLKVDHWPYAGLALHPFREKL